MDTLTSYATSSFQSTVGFSSADMFSWATSSLIRFYAELPVIVMYRWTNWLIAASVIVAIIFTAAAVRRFFRL